VRNERQSSDKDKLSAADLIVIIIVIIIIIHVIIVVHIIVIIIVSYNCLTVHVTNGHPLSNRVVPKSPISIQSNATE
jgi:flagellar basal body-associated protein FliL